MIENIMLELLKSSLFTSLIIGILLLMVPLLQKRYRAKWRYIVWLVIAVRLIIPFNLSFPQAPIRIDLPEQHPVSTITPPSEERPYVQADIPPQADIVPSVDFETSPELADSSSHPVINVTPLWIAGLVWIAGVLIFLMYQLGSYQLFLRKLSSSHTENIPDSIKETVWKIGVDLGICKLPEPLITDVIDAPVLIGVLHPRILLPHSKYSDEEINFIMRHELVHYRRRDMWYKLVLMLATAVHWFNPFVYLMTIQAAKDIELACDDDVIRELDSDTRAKYGDTILSALPKKRRLEPVFSTHFGGTKENVKGRLRNLFDMAAKRRGIVALCVVFVCTLSLTGMATFGYAAAQPEAPDPIANAMIHARASDGTWAAASSIEGKTWQEQIDEEIKWLEDLYKGYNTRFVITETLPKTEAHNVFSRIDYLYENSDVFQTMSQMKNGVFTVEDGQSFSRFGANYNPDMMQRTAVMVDNDGGLTLDINYNLTKGKLAVWLVNPDGNTVYLSDLQKMYQDVHSVAGQKGLWSVITISEGNENDSMEGNISIVLRQTGQSQTAAASSNLSIQRLGAHAFKSGDALTTNVRWSNSGDVMLLYTDKNYNDDEILALLQGLPGVPEPDYSKVDQTPKGSIFNFSKSQASPLTWNTDVIPGTYYFYLIQFDFTSINRLTGNVNRIDAEGNAHGIWEQPGQNDSGSTKSTIPDYGQPAFQVKSNNEKNVISSGSFQAKAGQKLEITYNCSIKGGTVDLFLFSPSGSEQRMTFGGSAGLTGSGSITIPMSAGTWAYNCTGFFDSGEITVIGAFNDAASVGMQINQASNPNTDTFDAEALRIMDNSGTWGDSINRLLPSMSPAGVEKVVDIYLERHLFPNITPPQAARQVAETIEPALKYMTKEAGESAISRISSYY